MSEAITSIDLLLGGASNIAWVSYPHPSDSFCYVYPQYACASRGYAEISPEAFPDCGAIYASHTTGGVGRGCRCAWCLRVRRTWIG